MGIGRDGKWNNYRANRSPERKAFERERNRLYKRKERAKYVALGLTTKGVLPLQARKRARMAIARKMAREMGLIE